MNPLPLTTLIFSLIAGGIEMRGSTSDTKGDILGRYKGREIHEPQEEAPFCSEIEPIEEEEIS